MHWDDRKGPGGNLERFKFKGPYDSYDHFESILWLFLLGVLQMELYQLLSFFFLKKQLFQELQGKSYPKCTLLAFLRYLYTLFHGCVEVLDFNECTLTLLVFLGLAACLPTL